MTLYERFGQYIILVYGNLGRVHRSVSYRVSVTVMCMHKKEFLQMVCSPDRCTWKINLPTDQKGYVQQIQDHVRKALLARKIMIYLVHFCEIYFWPLFWNNFTNNLRTKRYQAGLNSPSLVPRSQVLLRCLHLLANWFLIYVFKEAKLVCLCSIIKGSHVQVIVGTK